MTRTDVLVIGSGPAGLAAAFAASRSKKRVVILEKMDSPGMKLLASGGSRCNVTNVLETEDFARRFGKAWRFLLPALCDFSGESLLCFFEQNGVPLELTDGFHYFPRSGKARDVLELFLSRISSAGGKLFCGKKVVSVTPGHPCTVKCADGEEFSAKSLVLACGGRGYPALGGSMAGYTLAENLGHSVTPLYPAMTGIICSDPAVGECAGISLDDCIAEVVTKGREKPAARGELLFTHNGFSAFAILDLAGAIAAMLDKTPAVKLKLDLLPKLSSAELSEYFAACRKNCGTKHVSSCLSEFFPRRLAQMLVNGTDPEISRWKKADCDALLTRIKQGIWEISGVEKWEKAMVTAGGVSLKEVDSATLASSFHDNIFFAGEMLDVTGPCGGFNITWALASGMLAGTSAGNSSAG